MNDLKYFLYDKDNEEYILLLKNKYAITFNVRDEKLVFLSQQGRIEVDYNKIMMDALGNLSAPKIYLRVGDTSIRVYNNSSQISLRRIYYNELLSLMCQHNLIKLSNQNQLILCDVDGVYCVLSVVPEGVYYLRVMDQTSILQVTSLIEKDRLYELFNFNPSTTVSFYERYLRNIWFLDIAAKQIIGPNHVHFTKVTMDTRRIYFYDEKNKHIHSIHMDQNTTLQIMNHFIQNYYGQI